MPFDSFCLKNGLLALGLNLEYTSSELQSAMEMTSEERFLLKAFCAREELIVWLKENFQS